MIIAGTGHRPDKLGGYDDETYSCLVDFARTQIDRLKPDEVISGMALGWDMALAQTCVESITPFCAAIPFVGQESRWPQQSQIRYQELLKKAKRVVTVNEGGYDGWKMQTRNQWMVDQCDVLLALWDGSKGGTRNCLWYADKIAKRIGKPHVDNVWPMWEKFRKERGIDTVDNSGTE